MTQKEYLIEIKNALESGKYPIAGKELFRIIDDKFYLNSKIKEEIEYFLELYTMYYEKIISLNDEDSIFKYLNERKKWDIANNQSIEGENLKEIDNARKKIDKTAIDKLIELNGKELTRDNFVSIHDTLLLGTTSEFKTGLRTEDNIFSGSKTNEGELNISWFPLLANEVESITDMFLSYYNDKNISASEYDKVVTPILFNNILTGLQLFKDGNSRYGRLIQTTKIWENLSKDMKLPIIYPSMQYINFRDQVKSYVKKLVVNPDDEKLWEKIILFHLHRIEDSIYSGNYFLDEYRRSLSKFY